MSVLEKNVSTVKLIALAAIAAILSSCAPPSGDTPPWHEYGESVAPWGEQTQFAATLVLAEVRVEDTRPSEHEGFHSVDATVLSVPWHARRTWVAGDRVELSPPRVGEALSLVALTADKITGGETLIVGIQTLTELEPGSDGFAPLVFSSESPSDLRSDWMGTRSALVQARALRPGVGDLAIVRELLEDGVRWIEEINLQQPALLDTRTFETADVAPTGLLGQVGVTASERLGEDIASAWIEQPPDSRQLPRMRSQIPGLEQALGMELQETQLIVTDAHKFRWVAIHFDGIGSIGPSLVDPDTGLASLSGLLPADRDGRIVAWADSNPARGKEIVVAQLSPKSVAGATHITVDLAGAELPTTAVASTPEQMHDVIRSAIESQAD